MVGVNERVAREMFLREDSDGSAMIEGGMLCICGWRRKVLVGARAGSGALCTGVRTSRASC